jgi:hypothetical protein
MHGNAAQPPNSLIIRAVTQPLMSMPTGHQMDAIGPRAMIGIISPRASAVVPDFRAFCICAVLAL